MCAYISLQDGQKWVGRRRRKALLPNIAHAELQRSLILQDVFSEFWITHTLLLNSPNIPNYRTQTKSFIIYSSWNAPSPFISSTKVQKDEEEKREKKEEKANKYNSWCKRGKGSLSVIFNCSTTDIGYKRTHKYLCFLSHWPGRSGDPSVYVCSFFFWGGRGYWKSSPGPYACQGSAVLLSYMSLALVYMFFTDISLQIFSKHLKCCFMPADYG